MMEMSKKKKPESGEIEREKGCESKIINENKNNILDKILNILWTHKNFSFFPLRGRQSTMKARFNGLNLVC